MGDVRSVGSKFTVLKGPKVVKSEAKPILLVYLDFTIPSSK